MDFIVPGILAVLSAPLILLATVCAIGVPAALLVYFVPKIDRKKYWTTIIRSAVCFSVSSAGTLFFCVD